MDIFGSGKKKISVTEVAWYFAIGYLIWLLIQCPSEGWGNLGALLQSESTWIVFQIITAALVAFSGIFTAFLLNLYYHGGNSIKTAEASLCIFGLLLILVEQSLLQAGVQNILPHLWAGRCFMIIGFILTVYQLFPEKKSDRLYMGLNGACLLLLIMICVFPQISVYGLVFPVIAVLVYDVCLIYNSSNGIKDGCISDSIVPKEKIDRKNTENESENESLEDSLFKKGNSEDQEVYGNKEVIDKDTGTAVTDPICKGRKEEEPPKDENPEGACVNTSKLPNELVNQTENEQPFIEKEIIHSLPDHFALLYLFDRKEDAVYRYDRNNGKLFRTGEGAEPELMTLIEESHKNAFADFLNLTGHRQISTKIWNAENSGYRDVIATAGSFGGKEEIEQILFIDSTETKKKYEVNIKSLEDKIEELKSRVELAEDAEHRVFMSTNELLNEIIARKSHESKTHLQHIKSYVEIIMREISRRHPELAMDEGRIQELSEASLLHDIGKIEVPDRILNKIEPLTPEEFEEMKKHTVYGARLINKMPYVKKYEKTMKYALEIALHHHERFDGNGYPDGLKGDQIPFFVQAAALADAYEALTSNRVYRAGIAHEDACKMIREGKCGVFSEEMLSILDTVGNELRDNHYRIETKL